MTAASVTIAGIAVPVDRDACEALAESLEDEELGTAILVMLATTRDERIAQELEALASPRPSPRGETAEEMAARHRREERPWRVTDGPFDWRWPH